MSRAGARTQAQERATRLGEHLARARERKGLTQVALAIEARVGIDWMRRLEQGGIKDPSLFRVAALAKALGIRIDKLIAEVA